MKFNIVVLFALCYCAQGKVLPDYLSNLICPKSVPDYQACMVNSMKQVWPFFLKGIPEMNFPPLDPFELPLMTVNRTLSELVSIKAILRNIKMVGVSGAIVDDFKANAEELSAEIRYTIPWTNLEMEYDVEGQLLAIPLRSRGFFSGNFTDTQVYVRGNLKYIEKDGEKYFRTDKIFFKGNVGDGRVKLTTANPQLQFTADLIQNFYNNQPRLVMDTINPIFAETAADLYAVVLDQILATIPAKELLPE